MRYDKIIKNIFIYKKDRVEKGDLIGEEQKHMEVKMSDKARDNLIKSCLLERDEGGLRELEKAYSPLCAEIARGVLSDSRDVEECVNDTLLAVWNAIPPANPESLPAFLCRIARRIAISRFRHNTRKKRDNRGDILLSEIEELLPDTDGQANDSLRQLISDHLRSCDSLTRNIFIRRYILFDDIGSIAKRFSLTENAVSIRLSRAKAKLAEALRKEGYLK